MAHTIIYIPKSSRGPREADSGLTEARMCRLSSLPPPQVGRVQFGRHCAHASLFNRRIHVPSIVTYRRFICGWLPSNSSLAGWASPLRRHKTAARQAVCTVHVGGILAVYVHVVYDVCKKNKK